VEIRKPIENRLRSTYFLLQMIFGIPIFLLSWLLLFSNFSNSKDFGDQYSGVVIKGNRNALFLVENGARRQFPDFFTFDKMGYNASSIVKIKDDILSSIPLGPIIKALPQPPPFRPDDHMFHEQCGDPDRMVIANSNKQSLRVHVNLVAFF
jgi:hypothetical protein